MVAFRLLSGTPGVRLGLALGASLLLHLAALLPAGWWLPRNPDPLPPLAVRLPPPEPPPEPTAAAVPPPAPPAAPMVQGAVSPELTFPRAAPPRVLQGRALDAALEVLAREEFYPRAAIARGLEGRVVLLLTLDGSGRLAGIEVASSSGHALLDDAALRAATRIGRLAGGQRQVLLPVEFKLE